MGLVTHEAPRLTYQPRTDMDKPLEAGMVLSIETTMHHPRRGFIKLEDTRRRDRGRLGGFRRRRPRLEPRRHA